MKIKGVNNKSIKKMFFIGTLGALTILKASNVAKAEEIETTSGSAIEVENKENSIEEIENLKLKTEIEEAETTIAKEKLQKLEEKNREIFAYKEFLSENTDGNLENDVIIAYIKGDNIKFSKEIDYLKDSEERNLEMFTDSEKRELFEIVKVKYTEFIESKDWKEEKKEEYIRINLQNFEKGLGIYKTPTEAHFFTDIKDAEDANFWYELKELEGKAEIFYKRVKLNDPSKPREKLDTPKITYKNTILACVEYTNDEGKREIAYGYIDNNSKTGTIMFNDLKGLTDEQKKVLLEMTKEKYEQIIEENDKSKYKYIDKWDSEMKFREYHDISSKVKRHSIEYEEMGGYRDFWINRHSIDYYEENEEEEEKTETKKEKEDKEKEEKTETKKEKEDKEKEEKTETKKEKEDKEKEEKTETEKENKEKEGKTETKKEKVQNKDNVSNLDEEEQKEEVTEEFKNEKTINDEKKLDEPFKKQETKEQKVSGEVTIGDNPPQKEKMPAQKRISIQGLREISAETRSEEINGWIDTLEKEVNQALEKLTNEKGGENEK